MEHGKYHALRSAAVASLSNGNPDALAAIIEAHDTLYNGVDYSYWDDNEKLVFGILTGMSFDLLDPASLAYLSNTPGGKTCIAILGDTQKFKEIANVVWPNL